MKAIRFLAAALVAASLSACVSSDPASRAITPVPGDVSVASKDPGQQVARIPQFTVADIRVTVPRSLKVSEANLFMPVADIVWRGEPMGDRYAQVQRIFDEAFAGGTAGMQRGPAVIVEAEVTRFHCLTEKTRYTVGGTHAMRYKLTLRDATTGQIIDGPRNVVADVKGAGGQAAIAEEMAGRTQRVVVIEALAASIRRELSAPVALPPGLVSQNAAPEAVMTVAQVY
ncbi:hypothetical protein E7811_00455 [Aliigemmobacter aestuarii]|uniref:ABC-type transport auxiliary lipoprotein component domain-containing protein n=1 Tax=Aliigemmobacter aestuarii TaxID=1445661 RepID=A0A4S3MQB5_9RHOB|nr:DUF6778 family protein [Gemmobacter aestuarii]THD84264.1 hypothetical protein E7811_00455 [Gemmobacter aestuarii]